MTPDFTALTSADNLSGLVHGTQLHALAGSAIQYLDRQPWCDRIEATWIARAWEQPLAVVLLCFTGLAGTDQLVWVITGVVPTVHVSITCDNWPEALETYEQSLREMVHSIRSGESTIPAFLETDQPTMDSLDYLEEQLDADAVLSGHESGRDSVQVDRGTRRL